jgi:hypothetical protein
MAHPQTWLEATKHANEAPKVILAQSIKPTFVPRPKPTTPAPHATPLKVQKLTRVEMVEHQLKGICYNCDDKCFLGDKCKEHERFMAISKEVSHEYVEVSLEVALPQTNDITMPFDPHEVEPLISLNALTGVFSPRILKLIGYIKHKKVIILVDSGNTHNFIHCHLSQETNCYIRVVNNFQIIIANGGSMKFGGRCENVRLQIGQYNLKYHMFTIDMGGCDIVLGAEWLHTLGPITMDFKDLTMQLQ